MPTPPTPLAGLRLLDLSRQLPGPFCSTLLADLGMEVLTITAPGDPFGAGIPFLGRNKRSMTLNLKADAGRAIFRQLAARTDVVLEGFRPGVTTRLGIDYDAVRTINPRAIYCSISGYGQDGPYRTRVGHDLNYLAQAGVLEFMGEAGRAPIVPGVQIADVGGGALMAVIGILSAVIARGTTGGGQHVDVAMLDGAFAWNVYHLLLAQLGDRPPARGREQLTGHYPCYAVYETRDGRHLTIGAYEEHFWATLCRHLDRPDLIPQQWAEDPVRSATFESLRATFRTKTLAEWTAELGPLDICFAPVATLDEAMADPQLRHRGMVVEEGGWRFPGPPIKLSATPATIRTPPVTLGQHTDAVLRELGHDDAAIARLHDTGAV